uniref:Reverse transcriptase domain-containing protein n=1 Tax=Tanacetum cinerariifolium TaxID=118510 RepID=A0A6L2P1W8_TANCI|nr:reverse transcriptase domain-containing protein [Tanacetum cinerariifolium]
MSRSVPAVVTRSVPAVMSRSVPAVESRSVPAVVSRSVPTVESRSVPAVESRLVPAVESRSVPAVESRSVPTVESRLVYTNLRIKASLGERLEEAYCCSGFIESDQTSNPTSSMNPNPKGRNRRRSKQRIKNLNLEEHSHPVVTMVDQRTMVELLHVPTEGYAKAIVVLSILAEQFELKHSLINMMTTDQFFGLKKDNLHDHIRWFNKITSTIKYKYVPGSAIKLMLFPFSLAGEAFRTTNLRNEISNFQQRFDESFHEAWDRYKDLLRACPHHGFTELNQLDTFYNALNPADQDSLNAVVGGNLLEISTQDVLTIIENKTKVCNSKSKLVVSQVKASPVKSVEETCATYGAVVNQGNLSYRPPGSGSLPSNTVANLKGELKDVTTRSGLVIDGPTVPTPPQSINPEVDERVKETFTDPDLAKYTIKCKALADLGASINLMPISVWKKSGLPKLIRTRMTLEPANRAVYPPVGIARDVFVSVGKFTFPADFVIVDYKSDPRVPLILGIPFLRTAHALIDVHGEEMIPHDGDEILTLNMRHATSSYSNQPRKESINLINVFNNSKGCNVLSKKLLDLDSTKDLHLPVHDNPLSGSTTYISNPLLEEFADELPLEYDDNLQFDIESDLKQIEFLHYQDKVSGLKDSIDQKDLANLADIFVDSIPEMVDALPSTNNEDKIFNPCILIQEKPVEIITRVAQDKKLAISNASLVLEGFDPPFYEPLFFKEVPKSKMLLPFSSKNKEKVFKPGIHTSEKYSKNVKTHAKGVCLQVFISSASIGNLPGHLAARLGCAEMKVTTWDDLAFKLITLGWNVKHEKFCKNHRWENDPGKLGTASDSIESDQTSIPTSCTNPNPKGHNRRRSKQRIENLNLEEHSHHVVTMADQRTMAELLCAHTEVYAEAIVVLPILAEQFELKHSLINMMTTDQFFGLEKDNPHDHIRWFNKITSTIKYKDVPSPAIKLMLFPFSLKGVARRIFLERSTQNVLTIIENKSKCLAAGGNTFPELRDNIQGYVSAAAVNQGNPGYRPLGSGSLPSNTVANPKGKLKAITTCSGLVIDGPTVPTRPQSINPVVDEPLLSNKEKLQELANTPLTPLNENCSAVILKKVPEKLRDPGNFLIPCGFSELKCKALANLGASINLMPLSVWKKLGLPELIRTRMTLELANRAICTPAGIARDVFVSVGKFTFPTDFVIVDYESDPRVPLILGRPFLRTARALIDVYGEEMILRDGDERLTLNMRHDTSRYSNQPQKESINLINVFNNSSEDFVEAPFPNQRSGNLTFSSHPELTSPKQDKDSSLKDSIDQKNLANLDDIFVDSIHEMFTDEHALDYSSPPLFDECDDDFLEVESDAGNVYDDPFDSKGEKIKESKLLIDELDLFCDFHPPFEYDSFISQDFSRVDALPSTNNEDNIFNPGICIQEKSVEIITRVVQDKKLAISNASLVLEGFDPPFYDPFFFKEVPKSKMILPFSSENKEKSFQTRDTHF